MEEQKGPKSLNQRDQGDLELQVIKQEVIYLLTYMGVFHFGHSTPASSHGLPYHGNFGTYSQYYSSRRSLRRVFLDLCFYLGVQVEKEKDIEAKIRTFEINERIALLIEASILCEITTVENQSICLVDLLLLITHLFWPAIRGQAQAVSLST